MGPRGRGHETGDTMMRMPDNIGVVMATVSRSDAEEMMLRVAADNVGIVTRLVRLGPVTIPIYVVFVDSGATGGRGHETGKRR